MGHKLGLKDWLFFALLASVLVVVVSLSGEEKTGKVPDDAFHRRNYEILKKTGSTTAAEKNCETCHNETVRPLPAGHPFKSRCLFCHRMKRPES